MSEPAGGAVTPPDPRWEAFAVREPFFAVLTSPKYLRANLTAAHRQEFFDSGETLVDWVLKTIEVRLVPEFAPMSVLEYGCGVGRLAIPFARRGGSVTAVDHSPSMLETARREAHHRGVSIAFQTPAELFAATRKFDLVNCYFVFQRLPPRKGLQLLRSLVGCLGAGGVGVFQFPYRSVTGRVVDVSRWLRERVPGLNEIANILRHKPPTEPFIPSHTYDLDDVLSVLDDRSIDAAYLAFEHHEGFQGAVAFVRVPLPSTKTATTPRPEEPIDVRHVVARTSIDELNKAAEEYFSSLTDWEHHLAKPFSKADEAPLLLTDVATLLHGMRLSPGATVLDFGAGTGWLSRFVTQLGCRVLLLDVSPTALRIARELYRRQPVIGDQPAPEFLHFDGRSIDLPDASVDRIVSFHAFHHVPNPADVIREFGRVLRPGGIAGFIEPGPRHSQTSSAQFEMRTYQVVENDVDVHDIARTARTCGFSDVKLVVFHGPPFHVSMGEFEDFLAGGVMGASWVTSTREFLRHVRSFFLFKEGVERVDSRMAEGLACEIHVRPAGPFPAGAPLVFDATVKNSGAAVWLSADAVHGGVLLGAHLYDSAGKRLAFDAARQPLTLESREIDPGGSASVRISLPPQPPGRYLVELDCVARGVIWFAQCGSKPATSRIEVTPA